MFNITSKSFSILNNMALGGWVAYITINFILVVPVCIIVHGSNNYEETRMI